MARFEICDCKPVAPEPSAADTFFELGMMYSSGRSVPPNFITAHKWFNLAAANGNKDAVRLRREIAAEMSEAEIAAAQRAARDWMRTDGRAVRAAA